MTEGYTAYADEDEVLVQDGLQYKIIQNEEMQVRNENNEVLSFWQVTLRYPPNAN